MVGLIAEFMGIPSVSTVVKMILEGTKVICEREIEGGQRLQIRQELLLGEDGRGSERDPGDRGAASGSHEAMHLCTPCRRPQVDRAPRA